MRSGSSPGFGASRRCDGWQASATMRRSNRPRSMPSLAAGGEDVARAAGGVGGGHVERDLEALRGGQRAVDGCAVDADDALPGGRARIGRRAVIEIAVALRAGAGAADEAAN